MKTLRVVTTERLLPDLRTSVRMPCDIEAYPEGATDEEIARVMAGADVFIGAEFRSRWTSPSLRLVQVPGAGTDGIERASLPPNCVVCNVYGHERAVAEHSFLLMLALQKQLFALDRGLRAGDWRWENRMTPELQGRKLLVVGLGRIGSELVRWGKFFQMDVSGVSRTASPERAERLRLSFVGTYDDLPRLLPEADFVVIAVPGTPETENLIDEKALRLMKNSAYLINVGRAPVVNELALYEALREKRIAGAGLDVWYQYPKPGDHRQPSELPFSELDNIIMTPHNGGYTPETMKQRWSDIAANLEKLARGEDLINVA